MKAQIFKWFFLPLILIFTGCHTPRFASLTPEQARLIARDLANEKALIVCRARPFSNGPVAHLVQSNWVWTDRCGWGLGDVEARVVLTRNGQARSVDVVVLDNRQEFF